MRVRSGATCIVPLIVPPDATELTLALTRAYEIVVDVTLDIANTPSKTESPVATNTAWPATNPCALDVVSVATLFVKALFVTVNAVDENATFEAMRVYCTVVVVAADNWNVPSNTGSPNATVMVCDASKLCGTDVSSVATLPESDLLVTLKSAQAVPCAVVLAATAPLVGPLYVTTLPVVPAVHA